MSDFFSSEGLGLEIVASAFIVAAAVAARVIGGRYIRRQEWPSDEERRRWLVQLRNASLLIAFFTLVVVWADELRTAALTFLAFAVAFVFATKELIMSVGGSLVRATSGSFIVGDRIKVGDLRGSVIDHSLLVTKLLEIGPGHVRTGRIIVMPNSTFLTNPVVNESRGHDYVLHSFTVPVKRSEWKRADRILYEAAVAEAAPYIESARAQMEDRAKKYSLSVPIVEPFVLASPASADTVELMVRVPLRARDVWQVENNILRAWLDAASAADNTEGPPATSL